MTLIAIPQDALCLKTEFGFSLSQRNSIEEMCQSIASVGLLNPLIVTQDKGRYVIVDGKKRFHAIKKLARRNKLPRTLNKVPCLLTGDAPIAGASAEKPMLLSEQDLVHEILCADRKGATYSEITARLDCSDKIITQARSLSRLNPKLMLAFINGTINLAQAAALSTLPNHQAQWDLLVNLGPFVTEPEIIAAIAKGDTVLKLPNGDTMILPSRAPISIFMLPPQPLYHAPTQLAA